MEPHGLFSWLFLTSFSLLPFFALHPAVSAISHGLNVRLWVTFAHQIKISSATTSLRIAWAVEVKWGAYSAGEERSSWGMSERATSLCVLFRGRIQFRFPQEEYLLACEGGYPIWSFGLPHHWKVLEDTCILTVRWPSIPGASQESRTISCDTIKGESLRSLAGS